MIPINVTVDVSEALALLRGPLTDRRTMMSLGNLQVALMKRRTVEQGRGVTGRKLEAYSTTPTYVSPASGVGLRLRPKGGRPTRRPDGSKGVSRHYEGGYEQYKRESTRRSSSHVDYVASGRTMASMRVLRASRLRAVVGFSGGEARRIAATLQARDAFFGLGPGDEAALAAQLEREIERVLDGRRRGLT